MAYGAHRFLYDNFLNEATLTPSSQAAGQIAGTLKTGTGSATMKASGSFTGVNDLITTVQIDDVSAGKEIAQATFRWRTNETASGTWEASGVPTAETFTTIGTDGKKVAWDPGSGDDFELNDSWNFWAYATFSPQNLIDLDRDIYFKSSAANYNIVADLGSAKNVKACVLLDTTIGATVTLEGNTSDAWGAPAFSQVLSSPGNNAIVDYIDETYRYWRLVVANGLEIANWYLGDYLQLAETWAKTPWGSGITTQRNMDDSRSASGIRRQYIYNTQDIFSLTFPFLTRADKDSLRTMWDSVYDVDTGQVLPLFIHYFFDESDTMRLCRIIADFEASFFRYQIDRLASINFEEVPRTRL